LPPWSPVAGEAGGFIGGCSDGFGDGDAFGAAARRTTA